MGIIRATMFMVGASIGAGFLSGAELVRFFSSEFFLPAVIISSVLFFFLSLLFLSYGRKYGGYEESIAQLFRRRGTPFAKAFLFVAAFVPVSGMLAGLDALLPEYAPLASAVGLVFVLLFLRRGVSGITILNTVLVPVLLIIVFAYTAGDYGSFYPLAPRPMAGIGGGILYAAMNVLLAAPVMMEAGAKMKNITLPALFSALIICVCAACILGSIYREGDNAINSALPFLYVMRGNSVFYVACALAILTSLVSALFPLLKAAERFSGKIKYAAKTVIILSAFALSRFGLHGIVQYFYPIVGITGLIFSAVCIFNEQFFKQYDEKIHTRGKQAENTRGAHNKVELKRLSAVNNQITESRARNNVFSHDRPDPSHADVDFKHRHKRRKGGGNNKFG